MKGRENISVYGESMARNKAKAKKLVKTLIKHDLNKSAAARDLGVSPQAVQDQVDKNPLVRTALEEYQKALEDAGATFSKSARVISEGMDAERTVSVEDFTADADEEERKGKSYRDVTEPDHHARLKANDQFLKVHAILSNKGKDVPEGGNHLHLHLGAKADEQLCHDITDQVAFFRPRKPGSTPRSNSKG